MLERLVRSWSLIKGSAAVVRDNKSLLLFPVVSGLATIVIFVSFLLPLLGVEDFDVASSQDEAIVYVWLALLYFALYFVSIFFNTALVSVALLRLSGSPAGLGDGFARAAGRLPAILGYTLLAASVGIVLRMIEERVGWIGRITAGNPRCDVDGCDLSRRAVLSCPRHWSARSLIGERKDAQADMG